MELKLVNKKLFEGFEIECYEDVSREDGDFFMTRKQIGEALETDPNTIEKNIGRKRNLIGEVVTEKIRAKDNKNYKTKLYNIEQIFKILSFSQQPKTNQFIEGLSKYSGYTPIKITSRYELDFEKILMNIFKDIIFIEKQYYIGRYRLDWYIPDYNLIIECDENGHNDYNEKLDKERTECINKELKNPYWIRFNPDEENFNIGNIINEILLKTIVANH